MNHRGNPWTELAQARYEAYQKSLPQIKVWRQQQRDVGRPWGLEDYFRANNLCFACKTTGVNLNQIGWDEDIPIYSQCDLCVGTGKIKAS